MQRVHADLGAQRIEIGVRRHHDGLVHIGHAIGGAAGVAELLAAELVVAGIGNAVGGAALAQFQRGQADEGLVGRTDGIGAVQRAVDQRMVGRLVQHAPVVHVDAVDEEIGIERGLRHEGQHLACIGIQRHQRAALPLESLFGHLLQAHVDGQHDVRAGHRVDAPQRAHGASARRHLDLFQAGASMQRFFPGLLDALLADHVGAAVVAQLAGALQILDVAVGDAADVTNHVGGRQALRILAHPAGAQFDAGKLEGMGGEPGRLGFIQVVAQLQAGVAAGLGRAARSGAGRSG